MLMGWVEYRPLGKEADTGLDKACAGSSSQGDSVKKHFKMLSKGLGGVVVTESDLTPLGLVLVEPVL